MKLISPVDSTASRKKGVSTYRENPFWDDFTVKIGCKKITVGGGIHVDDSGVAVGHSGIHVVKETDSDEFLKLIRKMLGLYLT